VTVVIVVLPDTALCPFLLKLAAAFLRLTAALAVFPDSLLKVFFGLANALFALIVMLAGLRRYYAASQQECAEHNRHETLAKHRHPLNFGMVAGGLYAPKGPGGILRPSTTRLEGTLSGRQKRRSGGRYWIRTSDFHRVKMALYR
jgi:hypothetical protein